MKKCFVAGKFVWLLIAAMLIALFWCGSALAESSGTCGSGLSWTLDDEGNLTISGTGWMNNYFTTDKPGWGTNIKTVVIGNDVTSIGSYAFYGCTALHSVTIDNSQIRILDYAFYDCSSLTNIMIPEGVTTIGGSAFYNCYSLERINIPSTISSMGSDVFTNCTNLSSVTIAEGATTLGDNTFSGCSSLKEITIPMSVKTQGRSFMDSGLERVTFTASESNSVIPGGLLYNCDKLNNVTIPNGITAIDDGYNEGYYGVFGNCTHLEEIELPVTMTKIGSLAFYNCRSLHTVSIPESVTIIGYRAFWGCGNLKNITIPESVTSIGLGAFEYCTNLKNITFPEGLTSIGSSAFRSTLLESINIPSTITSMGDEVFGFCSNLSNVTIAEGATTLGTFTFFRCDRLKAVTIPMSVKTEGDVFQSSGVESVTFTVSDSNSVIPGGLLYSASHLTSVTIPEGVTEIGDFYYESGYNKGVFAKCVNLEEIELPVTMTKIGSHAFSSCTSLQTLSLHSNITTIGEYAFNDCSSLSTVYYDGTEEEKDAIDIGTNNEPLLQAQWICTGHQIIANGTCGDNLTWELDDEGNLTISGTGSMWDFSASNPAPWGTDIKFVTIENGATSIGNNAFSGCWDLEGVSIGNGVTSIGDYAFDDCVNLLLITSSQHITSIGEGAFSGCSSLEAFEFKNCETVGAHAFENCISLQVANLPAVSVWSDYLFYGCWNLNSWDISSCTSIGNYSFAGCNSITILSFGDQFTSIGIGAYQDCINLKSVTISDDCKASFGDYAFRDCSKMTYITIPKSITDFGIDVFAGHSENLIAYVYENSAAHIYCRDHSIRCHFLTDQSFGNGFDLRRDGWALQNIEASFYYPSNYKIPWDRYAEVFDISSVASEIVMNHFSKPMLQEEWGGNCAGLASLAIWNYVGKIDLREYFSNTEGKSLCEYGYDELRKFFGVYAIKDQNVIKLIERAQLGQFTNARRNVEVFTAHDNSTRFAALIDYLQNNKTPLYISIHKEDGTDGHALVTNTAADPPEPTTYDNDNNYYRIKVYDCNYPYDVESSLGNDPYYTQAEDCWLYVNPVNGKWHYRNYVDGSIWFFDVASMNTNFIGSINRPVSPEEFVVFLNSVETLLDQDNGRYVWNNNISNIGTNVRFYPYCDGASDSSGSSRFGGTVVFPRSDKPISVSGQNDTYALFMSSDKILYAHTDDESTYEADVENNSITLHSSDNCTFDIVLDNDDSEAYSAVVLTGTASAGTTTITLNEDNTISAESTAVNFNVEVTLSSSQLDEDITIQCNEIKALDGLSIPHSTIVGSGACGDNLTWILYSNGTLIISGTGAMTDFVECGPWGKDVKMAAIWDGVTSIGARAFCECSSLRYISVPDSVMDIGVGTFFGCSNLMSIVIPNSVTILQNGTFFNCYNLSAISIPDNVTSIGNSVFHGCVRLVSITIPDGVTSIGGAAFSNCTSLAEVSIPDSVQSIGNDAFFFCKKLTSISIPDGVSRINSGTFLECRSLNRITIPDSVTSIDRSAFESCSSLTSISIPEGVTSIGNSAFNACRRLSTVFYGGTLQQKNDMVIGTNNDLLLAAQWKYMKSILTLPANLTQIESAAFTNLPEVYGVRVPESVYSIADDVFDSDIVIYAPSGSYAAMWASENGFEVIEE